MKTALRVIKLVIISVVFLLFVYPFFHELGHLTAAILSGAEIVSWEIFPIAQTGFLIGQYDSVDIMLISLAGDITPLSIILIPTFKSFYLYYLKLSITLLSAVIAVMSVIFIVTEYSGGESVFDDALKAVNLYPELRGMVLFVLVTEIIATVSFVVFSRPIEKMMHYLL